MVNELFPYRSYAGIETTATAYRTWRITQRNNQYNEQRFIEHVFLLNDK